MSYDAGMNARSYPSLHDTNYSFKYARLFECISIFVRLNQVCQGLALKRRPIFLKT